MVWQCLTFLKLRPATRISFGLEKLFQKWMTSKLRLLFSMKSVSVSKVANFAGCKFMTKERLVWSLHIFFYFFKFVFETTSPFYEPWILHTRIKSTCTVASVRLCSLSFGYSVHKRHRIFLGHFYQPTSDFFTKIKIF